MVNKDLLNICYKYFNRYINANELIEQLKIIQKDKEEINSIIKEIQKIINDIPNKEDQFIINKKENIKNLIEKLDNISKDDKDLEPLNKGIDNLKQEYEKEIDCEELWNKITEYIINNEYFNKIFDSLSDYELLEFICQYIKAPFPPSLTQKEFDNLVKVGIDKDEREKLWRLAFNYENHNLKFDKIVDYFIKVKDGYYLSELISAVGDDLDIDNIIDKVSDKEIINYLIDNKDIIKSYITEEQFNKLKNKII